MFAMFSAVVSALSMGLVYLIDMAMVGNTYTRSSQAMLVSSVASFLPVPILFFLEWDNPPPGAIAVALAGGVVLMIANWLYFLVIFSDAGESTEVACYENSSVLLIVLATAVLSHFGLYHETLSVVEYVGIGIGALGLFGLALWTEKLEFVDAKHRAMLIAFVIFAAGYEMMTDWAMHLAMQSPTINTPLQAYLSVSPYFWIGLSTSVVAVFPKNEMAELRKNWATIVGNWRWIAAAEACALIAFGAMVYSFTEAHAAAVAMVAGSFPIIVFVGGIILRRCYGFSSETFPVVEHPVKKTIAVLASIIGAVLVGTAKRTR